MSLLSVQQSEPGCEPSTEDRTWPKVTPYPPLMILGQMSSCGSCSRLGMLMKVLKGQYKIYLKKGNREIPPWVFLIGFIQAPQLYLSRFSGPEPSSQLCHGQGLAV